MTSPEVAVEAVPPPCPGSADALHPWFHCLRLCHRFGLALAYLMREILMLLYVSALFAVVLSPVIHGIMRFHIKSWHPGKGLAIFLLLLSVGAAATLFFAFAMPPVVHDVQALISELPTRGPQLLDKVHHFRLLPT